MRKKIFKEHHLSSFDTFLENQITPPSLFYKNFPYPFLHNDQDFVKEYNDIIQDFQTKAIKLCQNHLHIQLSKINNEITNFKSQLISIYPNINDNIKAIEFELNEENKETLLKRNNKIQRLINYNGITCFQAKNDSNQDNSYLTNYPRSDFDNNRSRPRERSKSYNQHNKAIDKPINQTRPH